jgi:hypothetical protein
MEGLCLAISDRPFLQKKTQSICIFIYLLGEKNGTS